MLDQTKVETRFLPALADALNEWFPSLGGRAFPVSDATITKENVPTLPLAMLIMVQSDAKPPTRSHYEQIEITDTFAIEFWMAPVRVKRQNGTETPFWTYYPYESLRDTLVSKVVFWEDAPNGERIAYKELKIVADHLAVTLAFMFTATFLWCPKSRPQADGIIKDISFQLCAPESCVVPNDPCPPCPSPCP